MKSENKSTAVASRLWLAIPPAWRYAVVVFITLRILLGAWMWGVRQVFSQPIPPHPVLRPYLGVTPETNPWLEPWQRWDTLHYQAIAERGYQAYDSATFTPPLYPLLMRLLAEGLGSGTLAGGMLISNLAYLCSLAALYNLALHETGEAGLSRRSLIYLASFPTAFFFLAAYTEALFLLAAILSLYATRQGRWGWAGMWGGIAALTRLTGMLLIIPLTFAAWQSWRADKRWQAFLAPGLALAGAAIFPLYVWVGLGLPPWTPFSMQTARFAGGLTFPGVSLWMALRDIFSGSFVLADVFDAGFLLLFLASTPAVFRHLPAVYGIYQASFLLLFLARYSELQPLLSTARYVLALFPAFIVFAAWGQNAWVNRVFLYLCWIGLLLLAGQYAIWGWVG